MVELNLGAAWVGIVLGFVSGAVIGLGFSRDGYLGGYDSWRRRLVRLGHISFFGLAFINLAFVLTLDRIEAGAWARVPSVLLVIGAATMPAVCFLAAWRKGLRHLFAIPVVSLIVGGAWTCVLVVL